MLSRRSFLLASTAMVTAPRSGASEPDPPAARERIPVLAWLGPPANQTTVDRYRELAECGFTHNFSEFPDLTAMGKALEVAEETGIRLFVSVPQLESDPAGVARRFKDHPANAGYHLRDEPAAADFPALARRAKAIQAVDAAHGCYINLYPDYASPKQLGVKSFEEYLDRFAAEVPAPYLSYDYYPITFKGLRPTYYRCLETVSKKAQEIRKPLWAFALSVAHDPYPVAELSHLRLQVFSDLAYGAQCIQYFTYWTPGDTSVWNFHQAPITHEGKRTAVYDRVKQVNREIQGLAPVFLGAGVLRVGHLPPLPEGTSPYRPEPPVKQVIAEGGALVSLLAKSGSRFLVVVNRDYGKPVPVTVTLDGSRPVREVPKDGPPVPVAGGSWSARLEPGDIAVLAFPGEGG